VTDSTNTQTTNRAANEVGTTNTDTTNIERMHAPIDTCSEKVQHLFHELEKLRNQGNFSDLQTMIIRMFILQAHNAGYCDALDWTSRTLDRHTVGGPR
jgi:hypothetical protein